MVVVVWLTVVGLVLVLIAGLANIGWLVSGASGLIVTAWVSFCVSMRIQKRFLDQDRETERELAELLARREVVQ